LEEKVGAYLEDDEETHNNNNDVKNRPYLRDLRVDPSTLCKLADALASFASSHENNAAWTFLKVSTRLLVSKKGHLLKECKLVDVFRLCRAAAKMSTMSGRELRGDARSFIQLLLPRRVVQLLNSAAIQDKTKSFVVSKALSPPLLCEFIWALSELGVQLTPATDKLPSTHRKLLVTTLIDLDWQDIVSKVPLSSTIKVVKALVCMNAFTHYSKSLLEILKLVESRISTISNLDLLCDLAECISSIRQSLPALETSTKSEEKVQMDQSITNSTKPQDGKEESNPVDAVVDSLDPKNRMAEFHKICDRSLSSIAETAQSLLSKSRPKELRRLLVVLTGLPFQADELVEAIDKDVDVRMKKMDETIALDAKGSPEEIVRRIASRSNKIAESIEELLGNTVETPFKLLTNAIRSLFEMKRRTSSTTTTTQTPEEDKEKAATQMQLMSALKEIREITKLATNFSSRNRYSEQVLQLNNHDIDYPHVSSAAMELGRCIELISSYHRIEFKTGARRSRYDEKRRSGIRKRVLSRLLEL